jgi:3-polyprenyl-4-hydroxybenzoate decarboxylase
MDERSKWTAKPEAAASRQSMRAFLSVLAGAVELVSISEAVNLDYEVAACLAEAHTSTRC